MQLDRPFFAIAASADGDVLRVLAQADSAFAISTLRGLMPPRSIQGVRNSLERLAEQGIVLVDETARTRTYRLNRSHLLAEAIMTIADSRARFFDALRTRLVAQDSLVYAAVYGSAARGDMRPDSDIDLLLVCEDDADRAALDDFVAGLEKDIRAWTGNAASPLVVAAAAVHDGEPVFASVRDEGVVVGGEPDWLSVRLRADGRES